MSARQKRWTVKLSRVLGCSHQWQIGLEDQQWCHVQVGDEQVLISKEAQILRCVQKDVGDLLPACSSECLLLCCCLLGRQHQRQRCQKDEHTNPQGWNHHWSESGSDWVSEGQEVTEQAALHHGPSNSPPPYHTAEAAELLTPQTYSVLLPWRTLQGIIPTILYKAVHHTCQDTICHTHFCIILPCCSFL